MGKGNCYQGRGGGREHPRQNNYSGNCNAAPTTTTEMHRDIKKGLETVFFAFRNLKDTAEFEKKTTLSRYVSTQAWRGYGLELQSMDKWPNQQLPNW